MDIVLPTENIILAIHDTVIAVSGGRSGIHDAAKIKGAVERPQTYTQYVSEYDVDTICALLIDSIARNHGFNDGNKRTALLTTIVTYRMNKVIFKATVATNTAFDELVMWVVKDKPSIDAIVLKLKEIRSQTEGAISRFDMINSFVSMLQAKAKNTGK